MRAFAEHGIFFDLHKTAKSNDVTLTLRHITSILNLGVRKKH